MGDSEEDIVMILGDLKAETEAMSEFIKGKVQDWIDYCSKPRRDVTEQAAVGWSDFCRKLEQARDALLDMSPLPNLVTTNRWLINSYIWGGVGSTMNYLGQDVGRFIAPLIFGWCVSNMWAGITAFILLPLAYLTIESCPVFAEQVGSNQWTPVQHRLHMLTVCFLMGAANGFALRHLPNSAFIASVPLPIAVGIAAYYLGPMIDKWTPNQGGANRVHVIIGVLVAGLLPNAILNSLLYGFSSGSLVSFMLNAVLMVVRFQFMIWRSGGAAGSEWVDRFLPIIMTDIGLICDFMTRSTFSSDRNDVKQSSTSSSNAKPRVRAKVSK